mgnify:FL=1
MNWIQHNLTQRLIDKSVDFKLELTPSKFKIMDFHDAANYTARRIADLNIPLYLALSGGVDSEYILLCFHRNKIPINPIIVKTSGNHLEASYAFYICKKLNIVPIVLDLSDDDNLNLYTYCVNKLNAVGIYSMPTLVSSKYAKNQKGILITGDHFIEDNDESTWMAESNEWDYYHTLLSNEKDIVFYNHTPELVYSTIYEFNGLPMNEFKHQLYQTTFRPKIYPIYTDEFNTRLNSIRSTIKTMPKYNHILGHKNSVLEMMQAWNT